MWHYCNADPGEAKPHKTKLTKVFAPESDGIKRPGFTGLKKPCYKNHNFYKTINEQGKTGITIMAQLAAAGPAITFISSMGEPVCFPAADFDDLWCWGDGHMLLKCTAPGGMFTTHMLRCPVGDQTEFLQGMQEKLRAAGLPVFKLHIGSLVSPFVSTDNHYACLLRADRVALWHLDHHHRPRNPTLPMARAIVIDDHPFFLDEDELADFYHDIYRAADPANWLRFSPAESGARCVPNGLYCVRRDALALATSYMRNAVTLGLADRRRISVFVPGGQASADCAVESIADEIPELLALRGGTSQLLIRPDAFRPHMTKVVRVRGDEGLVIERENWHIMFPTYHGAVNALTDLKLGIIAQRPDRHTARPQPPAAPSP